MKKMNWQRILISVEVNGMTNIKQWALIYIDFEPSKGSEIKKRRSAIVISRDKYNLASHLIIVCPITSTQKERPYFVSLQHEKLMERSKVNTKQVYSLDYTKLEGRKVQIVGQLTQKELMDVAQHFLLDFNFHL